MKSTAKASLYRSNHENAWVLYTKTTNYWQAVLRVGLPFIVLYRGTDYLIFRIVNGNCIGLRYPWRFAVVMDVVTMLILSTLWWSLMRSGFGKHRRPDNENGKPGDSRNVS
jgi:hypothetical protein